MLNVVCVMDLLIAIGLLISLIVCDVIIMPVELVQMMELPGM